MQKLRRQQRHLSVREDSENFGRCMISYLKINRLCQKIIIKNGHEKCELILENSLLV